MKQSLQIMNENKTGLLESPQNANTYTHEQQHTSREN